MNAEQEREWAQQLAECRRRFVARVKDAVRYTSPTRRYALYQEWRQQFGDDIARESARYTEGVMAGRLSIYHIERMIPDEKANRV
jgi:hypothetical protein